MISLLLKKIEALFESFESNPELLAFPHRVEVEIADISALEWLSNHDKFERLYWESRDSGHQIAGLGIADCIASVSRCDFDEWQETLNSRFCKSNQDITYVGGFRFPSPKAPSPDWEKFGYYRFVLPLFTLEKNNHHTTLSCHVYLKPYYSQSEQLAFIKRQLSKLELVEKRMSLPKYSKKIIEHTPSNIIWKDSINQVKLLLKSDNLDKVVFARKSRIHLEQPIDPSTILGHLPSEASFKFLFQVSPDESFIGSSPECLYTRTPNQIFTEAIAGTKARGKNHEEDIKIENELKISLKDQEEHHYVSKMISNKLAPLCENLNIGYVEVVKLSKVQHLYQKYVGELNSNITDADLLKALYPTPAVAGYPVHKAIEMISEEEPFDRGWYAGIVGCVSPHFTQFSVSIRSAHLKENYISLFAGAGIVEGSEAELEWDELNHKIAPYLTVLGLD